MTYHDLIEIINEQYSRTWSDWFMKMSSWKEVDEHLWIIIFYE